MNKLIYNHEVSEKRNELAWNVFKVVSASLLITLSAKIVIPLGFSPVPVTMQSLAILLIAIFLGSNKAILAVMTYILQGLIGFPVFAGAGFGAAYILGPTGGYLIGFVLAAYIAGNIGTTNLKSGLKNFGWLTLATLTIYVCGISWLSVFTKDWVLAINTGMLPFLIGDAIKLITAFSVGQSVKYFKKK